MVKTKFIDGYSFDFYKKKPFAAEEYIFHRFKKRKFKSP